MENPPDDEATRIQEASSLGRAQQQTSRQITPRRPCASAIQMKLIRSYFSSPLPDVRENLPPAAATHVPFLPSLMPGFRPVSCSEALSSPPAPSRETSTQAEEDMPVIEFVCMMLFLPGKHGQIRTLPRWCEVFWPVFDFGILGYLHLTTQLFSPARRALHPAREV